MSIQEMIAILERSGYRLVDTHSYRDLKKVYDLYHGDTFQGHFTKAQLAYEMFGEYDGHLE